MSSSSMSSPPSSSSSTTSSFSSSLPSPAIAASRMRRQRRNAISRGAESEWDARAPNTPASPSIPPDNEDDDNDDNDSQAASPPPWRDDELVCPLARSSSPSTPPPCALPLIAPTEEQVAEIQAMLARFAFPSPTRKHRRSGQIIDHSGTTTIVGLPGGSATNAGTRGCSIVRRAPCAHCGLGGGSSV